jgi:hypothetical protein
MNGVSEIKITPDELIINKIYLIRDKKIMLDRDLSELYGVKSIRLREQVKRNAERFPEHFMFQLTDEETEIMVSQNAIPSKQHLGGSLPYAFTEHGIIMLANVLKSNKAVQVSIRIIEIFIQMRELILSHKDVLLKLEQLEKQTIKNSKDVQLIFQYLKKLLTPEKQVQRKQIGYKREG